MNFLSKDKKDKTMQIYFHSCLCSYLPRVPILVEDTVLAQLKSLDDQVTTNPGAINDMFKGFYKSV